MANYNNINDFFDNENLVDSNNSQIVGIRFVEIDSDSEYSTHVFDTNEWLKDPDNVNPSELLAMDFSNGDVTTNVYLENGNYARIEIHPVINTFGLQNGGTIKTTLYAEDGTIIREGAENPFPNVEFTAEQRLLFNYGAILYLANFHKQGKFGGVEQQYGFESGFAVIPDVRTFSPVQNGYYPDTEYPIEFSMVGYEQSMIPIILDPIVTALDEADLVTPNDNANKFMQWIADATVPKGSEPSDDGKSGKESEPDGGNDDFPDDDGPSDNILPTEPPTEQVANVGLYGVWHLYQGDVRVLARFLWSDDFFENVIKNMASPLENIISFGIVPWTAFNQLNNQPFQICNVQVTSNGANYAADRIVQNFYSLDCGSINVGDVGRVFNTFYDYEPYTKYWLYLPFIGTVDLPCDDVARNGKVKVQYKFDIISGACVAEVVTYTQASGWNITGRYSGNILTTFPLTGANYMAMYNQLATSSVGFVASVATQNVAGMIGSAASMSTAKPQYSRGGSISNVSGLLTSTRKPCLIKAQPNAFEATTFKHDHGYKSNFTVQVGNAGGYVMGSASQMQLSSISKATQEELDEIQSLLGQGIYTA